MPRRQNLAKLESAYREADRCLKTLTSLIEPFLRKNDPVLNDLLGEAIGSVDHTRKKIYEILQKVTAT